MADLFVLEGDELVRVVGTSHYQDVLVELSGRRGDEQVRVEKVAALVPEPTNPHDPNAIAVQIDARLVGYLSREENPRWQDVVAGHEIGDKAALGQLVFVALMQGGERFDDDRRQFRF